MLVVQQLQIITGVAKGLTRTNEPLAAFDDSPVAKEESQRMSRAREDLRVVRLRKGIMEAVRKTVDMWCTDATVNDVSLFSNSWLHPSLTHSGSLYLNL